MGDRELSTRDLAERSETPADAAPEPATDTADEPIARERIEGDEQPEASHGDESADERGPLLPDGEEMTIFDAAERYRADGVSTIVLAGKEYGSGSSRDWAAKGPDLLGVRAAIAESYERIHRSNLLMCGIVPLQFMDGENLETLGLTGREEFSITGLENGEADEVTVTADGKEFRARVRLDTPKEREYLRHGGILQYVLRRFLAES